MRTNLSIPTDNLHRFKAVFGLMLIALSLLLLFWSFEQNIAHNLKYGLAVKKLESELLEVKPEEYSSADHYKFIRMELNDKIKKAYYDVFGWQSQISTILFLVGFYYVTSGFYKWRKYIQPLQDEMLKLEVEKLRLECENLKNDR